MGRGIGTGNCAMRCATAGKICWVTAATRRSSRRLNLRRNEYCHRPAACGPPRRGREWRENPTGQQANEEDGGKRDGNKGKMKRNERNVSIIKDRLRSLSKECSQPVVRCKPFRRFTLRPYLSISLPNMQLFPDVSLNLYYHEKIPISSGNWYFVPSF